MFSSAHEPNLSSKQSRLASALLSGFSSLQILLSLKLASSAFVDDLWIVFNPRPDLLGYKTSCKTGLLDT